MCKKSKMVKKTESQNCFTYEVEKKNFEMR